MNAAQILLAVALALAGAGQSGAYVPGPAGLAPRTTVYFLEPETFTDLKDRNDRTEEILAALKKHLIEQANRYVPSGFKFTVTVTDVDRAGAFEPWHGSQFDEIRIVKDLYPPHIKLVFRLADAEGKVLAEARRDLTDLNFLTKFSLDREDPIRYEKTLIDDWLRTEFRGATPGKQP
ncbi:MAG: DUF3016 domain-containing protein [Opitutus sp.]|nr:DUF3016 domain-containing protein [Opitutus sp.]